MCNNIFFRALGFKLTIFNQVQLKSPEECIIREIKEETGLILQSYKLRCIVTYVSTTWEGDKIFVEKIKNDNTFFTVKFEYDGEKLIKYSLKEY